MHFLWWQGVFRQITCSHLLYFLLQVHLGIAECQVQVACFAKAWVRLLYALLHALQICRERGNLGIHLFTGYSRGQHSFFQMFLYLCELLTPFFLPSCTLVVADFL